MQTMTPLAPTGETPRLRDAGALRGALALAAVSMLLLGLGYSLLGTALGQAFFPGPARGSLIEQDGRVLGSALVAQPFVSERYFHPRPSAAGYNPMALSGSNQARSNPDLRRRLDDTRAAVAQREGVDPAAVPGDLLTQSGSGIDPHLSPEAARLQVARVARVRGLPRDAVARLVEQHTEGPQLGLLGAPRVNVLRLNLALDRQP